VGTFTSKFSLYDIRLESVEGKWNREN
jgi:hypothetical protein